MSIIGKRSPGLKKIKIIYEYCLRLVVPSSMVGQLQSDLEVCLPKNMDRVSLSLREEEEERRAISSLPDFAEIFVFLQNFGPYMQFPRISLADLENSFRKGS